MAQEFTGRIEVDVAAFSAALKSMAERTALSFSEVSRAIAGFGEALQAAGPSINALAAKVHELGLDEIGDEDDVDDDAIACTAAVPNDTAQPRPRRAIAVNGFRPYTGGDGA